MTIKSHLIYLLPFFSLIQCNQEKPTIFVSPQHKPPVQTTAPIIIPSFPDQDKAEWLAEQIYNKITRNHKLLNESEMNPYTQTIHETASEAQFKMIPIPSGTFLMGSESKGPYSTKDQSPPHSVQLDAFWMADSETTWAMYHDFMENDKTVKHNGFYVHWDKSMPMDQLLTQPTTQYHDMTRNGLYKMDSNLPVYNITHHAANKFCEWLSYKTGRFYRLPTEAEWEYAARAGSTSRFPWGDDPSKASDYAWLKHNSLFAIQEGKLKKPNQWGLYDMIGNLSEWTADQYSLKYYKNCPSCNPWNFPNKRYPRVMRGGSHLDSAESLSVSSRFKSDSSFKELCVMKSIWYHGVTNHIGFRVVSPLKQPTKQEMFNYWNSDQWNQAKNSEDYAPLPHHLDKLIEAPLESSQR